MVRVILVVCLAVPACSSSEASSNETTSAPVDDDRAEFGPMPPPLADVGDADPGGCSPWLQDCPQDHKCQPILDKSTFTGRCLALDASAIPEGEVCPADPTLRSDPCDVRLMCLALDPDQPEDGTCVPLCRGSPSFPQCPGLDEFCFFTISYGVCMPRCNPLLSDCPPALGCYPSDHRSGYVPTGPFTCFGHRDDAGGFATPCTGDSRGCLPGFVCAVDSAVPGCPAEATSCCTDLCDTSAPNQCTGAADGQRCVPAPEPGDLSPELVDVGVCAIPA